MGFPVLPFARVAARDLLQRRRERRAPHEHLEAAVQWLERAQDVARDGGFSYGYSLKGGWRPAYIETTGYIASTFFELAKRRNEPRFRERAVRAVDWLLTVQNADGSFPNPRYSGAGIVFDTGQDLLGLVRAARETEDARYLDAARRAGRWLVTVADGEGRWTRNVHNGIPHVYNTRVAWALLALDRLHSDPEHERVARANLDWALSQERDGWFERCAFEAGVPPFTHTIAYAIRGLMESAWLLVDTRYLDTARRAAEAVRGRLSADGFLPGRIDPRGRPAARYGCLTGNCQMAIIWAELWRREADGASRDAAAAALRYVMDRQDLETADLDVRGAIKGSQPVWGGYAPLTFPNWATKFFVDALLRGQEWLQ